MQISAFSHPKDRSARTQSDDVLLVLPNVCGVFDGATDPHGISGFPGVSSGRFAAELLARHCASVFSDETNYQIPTVDLLTQLADKLASAKFNNGGVSRPTSTLALTIFGPHTVRIIVAGDSGVRVNGKTVFRHLKCIDDVSAAARIEVYKLLIERGLDLEKAEMAARRAIFQGLDNCVSEKVLPETEIHAAIERVAKSQRSIAPSKVVHNFLRQGIKSQSDYGNDDTHPLGFSVLNGASVSMKDIIDVSLDRADVKSLEIFSDGYFDLPEGISILDWERRFAEVEVEDPRKLTAFPNVKGSTASEFSDDRSIISINFLDDLAHATNSEASW